MSTCRTHPVAASGHLSLMAAYTPDTGTFRAPHYPNSRVHVKAVVSFVDSVVGVKQP